MSHDGDAVCRCTSDHRPRPLELHAHHVWPLGFGGPDIASNLIWLCPTAHVNVHEILRDLMRLGRLTYYEYNLTTTRTVQHYAYVVAVEGFDRWRAGSAVSA